MGSRNIIIGILALILGLTGISVVGTLISIHHKASENLILFLGISIVGFCFGLYYFRAYTLQIRDHFRRLYEYDEIFEKSVSINKIREFNESFKEFERLNSSFAKLMEKIESNSDSHLQFLQSILDHVNSIIIITSLDGEVAFINKAGLELLKLNEIHNLSDINDINKSLAENLINYHHGQNKLVKINLHNNLYELAIHHEDIQFTGNLKHLITIQNIGSEIAQKEMDSWQRLTKVITHEIMNSLTPITSISQSIKENLDEKLTKEDIEDLKEANDLVLSRSKGLLDFIENYRTLTHIPNPKFELIIVKDFFQSIQQLLSDKLNKDEVEFNIHFPDERFRIMADKYMLEQIIINLVVNAMDAGEGIEDFRIDIHAFEKDERKYIQVIDNGAGIPEEIMDKIFIPFYTSKDKGTGVGLAFSKYVMLIHKGNIHVESEPRMTKFELRF